MVQLGFYLFRYRFSLCSAGSINEKRSLLTKSVGRVRYVGLFARKAWKIARSISSAASEVVNFLLAGLMCAWVTVTLE